MDALLGYASSASSSDEVPAASASPSPSALTSSVAALSGDVEQRRRIVAQRLTDQRRGFAHRSSREENAFAFRGYAVKRRRRRGPNESHTSVAFSTEIVAVHDGNDDAPLIESEEELQLGVSTTESKQVKRTPLRRQTRQLFVGHDKAVNELKWHPRQPDLFLSASMDATVRVWKPSARSGEKCRRVLTHHSLGVKSAKWSLDGRQILTGGFDGLACCVDAETCQVRQELRRPHDAIPAASIERITIVHFHPTEPNAVLLGTAQGRIYRHDLREKTSPHTVTTYVKSFADVHDLLFLGDDGKQFVSSAGVLQCGASNQTLLVWDWRSATLLYDRLDSNMLPHSCLRTHPVKPYFVAQCSGNYATLYSSRAPYKCLKGPSVGGHRPSLRYEGGHEVEGYRIQCSFSRDGLLWSSGDANGRVAIYRTAGKRELTDTFQLYGRRTACICAEFQSSSADSSRDLLTGSFAGDIDLFQQTKP